MAIITLKNNSTFESLAGKTILESSRQQGVALEYSCRTGRCSVCKTKVIDGVTEVVQPEESLSSRDVKSGFILTCCREAKTDIILDIADLGELGSIKTKILPCRIDSTDLLTDDVIEVVLRTPPTSRLEYIPGQYVDIIGKNGLRRSYSIANAPRGDGRITLQIRKIEQGKMSQYWFEEAKANDLLRMEGPFGTFGLRKSKASELILLATGTGVAPLKAMLEYISTTSTLGHFKNIYLYWGGRKEQDIYWEPVFETLPLTIIPVLSRAPDWQGRKGYVQQAVIEDIQNLERAAVYACGSEAMIHSAYEALVAAGLRVENFYSDAFVCSS